MGAMRSDPSQTVRTSATAVHETSIAERGSFARASCATCGWSGPARRARAYAAVDIEEHRLLTEQAVAVREPELSDRP